MSDLANRKRKRLYLPFIIILVVFLLAAGGGTLLLFSKQRALKAEVAAKEAAKPAIGKPGAEPPHIRGSPKAVVTLEEFGDFECTPLRHALTRP